MRPSERAEHEVFSAALTLMASVILENRHGDAAPCIGAIAELAVGSEAPARHATARAPRTDVPLAAGDSTASSMTETGTGTEELASLPLPRP